MCLSYLRLSGNNTTTKVNGAANLRMLGMIAYDVKTFAGNVSTGSSLGSHTLESESVEGVQIFDDLGL